MKEINNNKFDFQNTIIYKDSFDIIKRVYKISKNFPIEENFGLKSQLRRAASSIALNLAEGWGRYNKKEKIQFYRISRASIFECIPILEICLEEKYINDEDYNLLYSDLFSLSRKFQGVINKLTKNK